MNALSELYERRNEIEAKGLLLQMKEDTFIFSNLLLHDIFSTLKETLLKIYNLQWKLKQQKKQLDFSYKQSFIRVDKIFPLVFKCFKENCITASDCNPPDKYFIPRKDMRFFDFQQRKLQTNFSFSYSLFYIDQEENYQKWIFIKFDQ